MGAGGARLKAVPIDRGVAFALLGAYNARARLGGFDNTTGSVR